MERTLPIYSIYPWLTFSGNFILNKMKRLPNLYGVLWNGIPRPSHVIIEFGWIISPLLFWILIYLPSRWVIHMSNPVSASRREISLSINKSAPFLLKTLCGYTLITAITSPGSTSGTQSPSPLIVYYSPSGEPLSISTWRVFDSLLTFFPLHTLHLLAKSIDSPCPPHSSQGPVLCEYIPGPICLIIVLIPLPLQAVHVTTAVASVPPTPLQVPQILYLSRSRSKVWPL